ncbi:DUF3829 domain-containing protein [Sphingomonas sp. ZT3P38]|uniref:DUF3829 domain-containing protein n=1 Tax=Parasphingomonas zepuensis TaxID=3096161 RepID=UPI002FC5CC12
MTPLKNLLILSAAAICLSACDKSATSGGNATGAVAGAAGASTGAGQLEGYIEGHNTLIGTFGFVETAEKYRKADVAHASTTGYFSVDDGWIGQGVDQLKKARALSGASSDLNAAADALILSMGKVRAHLANLAPYYSGKKYLDDKLARGKQEDPQMLAELAAAEKDLNAFRQLLDRDMAKRDEAVLAKLKSSGDLLNYNTKLALVRSNKLISLFNQPSDIQNAAILAKADAEVAIIEQAIADAHQQAVKANKRDPSGLSSLTTMIGYYRTLKQSHSNSDAEGMMRTYNQAVDSANTFGGIS